MKRGITLMRENILNLRERATELQKELDEAKRCHVGEVSRTIDQYEKELAILKTASSELTSEVQNLRSKLKDATRQVVEETRLRARMHSPSPQYSPQYSSLDGTQEGEESGERERVEISPSSPSWLGRRSKGESSSAESSSPSKRSSDFPTTTFSTPGYSDFQSMENAAHRRVLEREERGQRLVSLQHRLDSSAADLRKEVNQRHSPLVSPVVDEMQTQHGSRSPQRGGLHASSVMVDEMQTQHGARSPQRGGLHASSVMMDEMPMQHGARSPQRSSLHASSVTTTTTMSDELGQDLVEAEALAKSAKKRIEVIQMGVMRVQQNAASLKKRSPTTRSTNQKTRRLLHAIESKKY